MDMPRVGVCPVVAGAPPFSSGRTCLEKSQDLRGGRGEG